MDRLHPVGRKSSGKKTEVPEEDGITSRYLWTQGTPPALLWVSSLRACLAEGRLASPQSLVSQVLPSYLSRQTNRQIARQRYAPYWFCVSGEPRLIQFPIDGAHGAVMLMPQHAVKIPVSRSCLHILRCSRGSFLS